MATKISFGGGYAVGKNSWNKGFFNGTKVRTFAENNSAEIEVVGAFDSLAQPRTGDQVPSGYAAFLPSPGTGMIWGVQNSTLSNEAGGIGLLRISCVAVKGLLAAFDETWDIDMQEVQRSLKQHPKVLESADALTQIKLWEATPEALRTYTTRSGLSFRYYATTEDGDPGDLTAVTDAQAVKYLKAVTAGIETYNAYLPVVTRTTRYLSILTGTSSLNIPYSDKIGKFDTPSVRPGGFDGSKNWFKSADKYSRANNGTWTRTEQWTYTDDTAHSWIYED